ncbi:MAG: glycosyltransferase family 39 protein [Thermoanaerobaculales bacterium]|nr:glycosyltransferase family 39 protein [Thermoanaerobaculales bacterium]
MEAEPTWSGAPCREPLDRRPGWRWLVAAAAAWVAAVHATLWWLDRVPVLRTLWGDERTYLGSALDLLAGDPGWWPEPLWPPLYPQLLAGLIWLGKGSLTPVVLFQTGLLAVAAVVLGDLVRRLTGSTAAAVAVASVALGYPPLASFCHYLWPEVVHLFLFVALLWLLAVRGDRPAWCAVAGVALGLALLGKSLLLPFVPVLLVVAVWGMKPLRAAVRVAVVAGLAAATMAPTLAANARRTGGPGLVGSSTFNLWVGLNDVGRESFRHDVVWPEFQAWVASADSHAARDRILRERIRELVRTRGLAAVVREQLSRQYYRLFDAGCYLTDQLPGGAAQLQAGAGYLGAGPRLGRLVRTATVVSILGLYLAATAGLALGGCRGNRWVRVLVVFLVYNLLLFLWLHVKTRYRIQMLPAAFVGVGCLVAWFETGWHPRPSARRIAGATVIGGLLLWLALA